jgi:serine/threonine protein kinase
VPDILNAAAAKYVLRRRLGTGGMGEVHLGEVVTPAGTRHVAIKRLRAKGTDVDAGAPAATERMIAEARLVFQLTHANVCQVHDLAIGDQGTFIIMEYVDGGDLKSLVSTLSVPAVVYIVREVAKGLDYAHRRRDPTGRPLLLVHGDVTPKNILLSREGEVKLADFGIARALGADGPGNGVTAGTPGFIAPEAQSGRLDQRADIYALGACLYFALSKRVPGAGIDAYALDGTDPEVSQGLIGIVARATAARPNDRYSCAADLEHALSLHLAHRFPSFTAASLAKLVTGHARERQLDASAQDVALLSITGTSTFLSDASALPPADPARGTTPIVPGARNKARWWMTVVAGVTMVGITFLSTRWTSPRQTTDAPRARGEAVTRAGELEAPAIPASEGTVRAEGPAAHTRAAPATAPQGPTHEQSRSHPHRKPADHPRPGTEPRPESVSAEMGFLTVYSEPWGVAYVDGRRFADTTPFFRAPIAAGSHRVTVASPDRKTPAPAQTTVISANQTRTLIFKW